MRPALAPSLPTLDLALFLSLGSQAEPSCLLSGYTPRIIHLNEDVDKSLQFQKKSIMAISITPDAPAKDLQHRLQCMPATTFSTFAAEVLLNA